MDKLNIGLQWFAALIVALIWGHCMGCSGVNWSQVGRDEAQCATGAIGGALSTAADEAATTIDDLIQRGALPDSQQAIDTWKGFAAKYGFTAAACAIEHLVGDVFYAGPVDVCKVHKHHVSMKHFAYLRKAREYISNRRK